MVNDWQVMNFDDAIAVNPARVLAKGEVAPFIAMEDLMPFQRRIEAIQSKEYKGSGSRFTQGDTLLARITPCLENGKTAFISNMPEGIVGHGSTEFIVLSRKEGLTDNLFVYYLARDPNFRSFAIQKMEGTSGRQRVPVIALSKLRVNLPPLPEQRAIAAILGALDDKIELNRQMNQTLEAMAQTLFKSWFVDFEPFRDQGMEGSPLGPIPVGWRVGKIDDLAILGRRSIIPYNFPDELFDHYSIPAFDEYNIPKAEKGEQIKSNKYEVPKNAVLISKLNPRFPRVWFPLIDNTRRAISSTEFLVTITKKKITSEFVYSLFKSASFFEKFSALVTGTSSSHQRVRPDDLLRIDIVIPSTEAINDFTDLTAPIYELVQNNLLESATLAATRDTLLPKLLSGEIRIKEAEKFVEGAT